MYFEGTMRAVIMNMGMKSVVTLREPAVAGGDDLKQNRSLKYT